MHSLQVSSYNLRFVYKDLRELECNKDIDNSVPLLLAYGLISDKIREELKRNYKVITLDLSNAVDGCDR